MPFPEVLGQIDNQTEDETHQYYNLKTQLAKKAKKARLVKMFYEEKTKKEVIFSTINQ